LTASSLQIRQKRCAKDPKSRITGSTGMTSGDRVTGDIRALTAQLAEQLRIADIEQPRFEAQLILAHVLNVSRSAIIAGTPAFPDAAQLQQIAQFAEARAIRRVPFAYLRGNQEFYGLSFEVGPGVLIPRPETEMLVEFAIAQLNVSTAHEPLLVDVCCGTGCIGIAAIHGCKRARGISIDLSPDAVKYTISNAKSLGVEHRLQVHQADLLSSIPSDARADVLVSNPPYILAADLATLQPEVRLHEPHLALDGGTDGLKLVRKIVVGARAVLKPAGTIALEIGAGQAEATATLLKDAGFLNVHIHPDFAGIGRMVTGAAPEQ